MKHRMAFAVLTFTLMAVGALVLGTSEGQAATCKWKPPFAVGCDGDTLVIAYSNPANDCPGSTVDIQRQDCPGGTWTTIATNVTSPARIPSPAISYAYRLVVNCSCGGTLATASLGCWICP